MYFWVEKQQRTGEVLLTCSLPQHFSGGGLGLHMTTGKQRPQQEQHRQNNHLETTLISTGLVMDLKKQHLCISQVTYWPQLMLKLWWSENYGGLRCLSGDSELNLLKLAFFWYLY